MPPVTNSVHRRPPPRLTMFVNSYMFVIIKPWQGRGRQLVRNPAVVALAAVPRYEAGVKNTG